MNAPNIIEKPKKKTREEKAKTEVRKEVDGLCATCNNKPDCAHFKARGPVHQCEEYDGYQEPRGRIEHIATTKKGNGNGQEATKFKGLCVNCDHRETCVNANLEGGVWHCEEYQ